MNKPKPKPRPPCLILTCTIDVKGVSFMSRSAIADRLGDYKTSLRKWIADPTVNDIVLVENSGSDLFELEQIAKSAPENKIVEFISCDTQDFPRHLGKGYGETLALTEVAERSASLRQRGRFLKVNGRYFLKNAATILRRMPQDADIYCSLTQSMRYADSRVFGGSFAFLRDYVCEEGLLIDDTKGVYFEHRLAAAALKAISDGKTWCPIVDVPNIVGVSGTFNTPWKQGAIKRTIKSQINRLKKYVVELP